MYVIPPSTYRSLHTVLITLLRTYVVVLFRFVIGSIWISAICFLIKLNTFVYHTRWISILHLTQHSRTVLPRFKPLRIILFRSPNLFRHIHNLVFNTSIWLRLVLFESARSRYFFKIIFPFRLLHTELVFRHTRNVCLPNYNVMHNLLYATVPRLVFIVMIFVLCLLKWQCNRNFLASFSMYSLNRQLPPLNWFFDILFYFTPYKCECTVDRSNGISGSI